MRSVLVHFKKARENDIKIWLNSNFCEPNENGEWRLPNHTDSTLYINFYRDYETEFEPKEYSDLIKKLGMEPSASIAVDVSGKIDGIKEVNSFLMKILEKFDGLVSDDYSDHLWSLREIKDSSIVAGEKFFDFTGTKPN